MIEMTLILSQLVGVVAEKPENFGWFLGAGTSRTAGLPTASDIIWDLKRRYYRQEENRDVSPQDIQNEAVRDRVQSFMDSRGFPPLWSDGEYSIFFQKIFGDDKERQRKYLRKILSEEEVTLSIGNRVLGALVAARMCRAAFTTNFDSVVEKAVAEMGGSSLSAYHLEGAKSASKALSNEEYPFYCKLHGDFRFESLKNLSADLAEQNADLSKALLVAGGRFGFVVVGYSGRDASVMDLFAKVLDAPNPFPHGLYWTGLKGSSPRREVDTLLIDARKRGVTAEFVEIETFDALMSRLWRNIDGKPPELDSKVMKSRLAAVDIPLPSHGQAKPILRLNGLPIVSLPTRCLSLTLQRTKDWGDLRRIRSESEGELVLTKAESVWCWGTDKSVRDAFGTDLISVAEREVPTDFRLPENLHVKAFLEEAMALALTREKPLLARMRPSSAYIIADPHAEDVSALDPLQRLVGKTTGLIPGLLSPVTEMHPEPERIRWAEAVRLSLDYKAGRRWLLLDPDIWIWPTHARKAATEFLDRRKANRFNRLHNQLLDAWVHIVLGTEQRNADIIVRCFPEGTESENPAFGIGSRTAFSRRLTG